jgi:hypothetical protein
VVVAVERMERRLHLGRRRPRLTGMGMEGQDRTGSSGSRVARYRWKGGDAALTGMRMMDDGRWWRECGERVAVETCCLW